MKKNLINRYSIIALCGIILDQLSKFLICKYNYWNFEIVTNTGMMFGFKYGNIKNLFLCLAILCLIFVFIKNQKERINNLTKISLSFITAGILSNILDRIFRGGVIEFANLLNIFSLNLAYIYIILGWILLVIFIWKQNEVKVEPKEEEN